MHKDIEDVLGICFILHAYVDGRPEEIDNGFLEGATQAVDVEPIEVDLVVSLHNASDLVVIHKHPEVPLRKLYIQQQEKKDTLVLNGIDDTREQCDCGLFA